MRPKLRPCSPPPKSGFVSARVCLPIAANTTDTIERIAARTQKSPLSMPTSTSKKLLNATKGSAASLYFLVNTYKPHTRSEASLQHTSKMANPQKVEGRRERARRRGERRGGERERERERERFEATEKSVVPRRKGAQGKTRLLATIYSAWHQERPKEKKRGKRPREM